jgi:hypothetical protein
MKFYLGHDSAMIRPVLSLDYSGTILWYYFMAGAEIVPPNSLSDRNKKSLIVLFFLVPLTCVAHVITSKEKSHATTCVTFNSLHAGDGCFATIGGGGSGEDGGDKGSDRWGDNGGRNNGRNRSSGWGIQQSNIKLQQ